MTLKALIISDYRSTHTVRPEAEIFLGLKRMGLDIHIMTYGDSEYAEKFRQAGIKVIDFHPQKKFDKDEIAFIREELIRENYQILHLFNSKSIVNGIRAVRKLPVKVVLYRGFTGNIHWYDPFSYLKYLHPRVDKISCNSHSIQNQINRQLFFDKQKTITINKGHLLDWYKDVIAIDRRQLQLDENVFLMSCVANARPMKGVKYLLDAMDFIPEDLPIHLLIIGNGMDTKQNLKIIGKSKNKERIHLLGFRKDALQIVASSNVFVLSSIKGESITKSVIEAMSLGITPLITDISGNKGLVINHESGLVVHSKNAKALADGMLELYYDQQTCRHYGKAARERIDIHFNHKDTVQKTYKLYKELTRKM